MTSEVEARFTATIDNRRCPPPPPPPPFPGLAAREAVVGPSSELSVQPLAAAKIVAVVTSQRCLLLMDRDMAGCSPGRGGGTADGVLYWQSESGRETRHAETPSSP